MENLNFWATAMTLILSITVADHCEGTDYTPSQKSRNGSFGDGPMHEVETYRKSLRHYG